MKAHPRNRSPALTAVLLIGLALASCDSAPDQLILPTPSVSPAAVDEVESRVETYCTGVQDLISKAAALQTDPGNPGLVAAVEDLADELEEAAEGIAPLLAEKADLLRQMSRCNQDAARATAAPSPAPGS